MKRKWCLFFTTLCLLLFMALPAWGKVQASPQSVLVDGETVAFEVYNIDGSNYFKLRDLAYALKDGANPFAVEYVKETESIVVTTGQTYTPVGGELAAGKDNSASAVQSNQSLTVNGKAYALSPWNIGGSNFFRLRDLGALLGFGVSYNSATDQVLITSDGTVTEISVHFLDVGQGDAIFIDDGEYEILIDAGTSAYGTAVSDYVEDWLQGPLDLVIATHPHADHIGGLPRIFQDYTVTTLVDSGVSTDTQTYQAYAQGVSSSTQWLADKDMTFTLPSGATLTIVELLDEDENLNNVSVAALLTYGEVEILFSGDNEAEAEQILASKVGDVDVFKAGHHGSRTANSLALLQKIQPEYVVISCGQENTYGHPHTQALANFAQVGAVVYGTMTSGTIVLTTDGSTYSFNTSKALTASDAGDLTETESETENQTQTQPTQQENQPVGSGDIIGNLSTHKVHLPSCSGVSQMAEKNKVYFSSLEEAYAQGYQPCGICLQK